MSYQDQHGGLSAEEYFLKKEQELIEKLRQRDAKQAEREELSEHIGIVDDDIMQTLYELGYNRNTIALLYLLPLIHVGWASGSVTARERKLILEAAHGRGISEGSTAYQQLQEWFEKRPDPDFFEKTLRIIGHLILHEPEPEQAQSRHALFTQCIRVAAASGTILGRGSNISDDELRLLEHIAKTIGQSEEQNKEN